MGRTIVSAVLPAPSCPHPIRSLDGDECWDRVSTWSLHWRFSRSAVTYVPGRGGQHAEWILEGFGGVLQVDGDAM